MFKSLFKSWNKFFDSPSITYYYNIWFLVNIRLFRVKLINTIILIINSLNSIKNKHLGIFYKTYSFENIYMYLFSTFLLFIFILFIFL